MDAPGPDHVRGDPSVERGHPSDCHGVLRQQRRRGCTVRVRVGQRAAATRHPVRGRVLRQHDPGRHAGRHPKRRLRQLRLGRGRTGHGAATDGFSARWTRTATYDAGTYRFTATGDDGISVLLDGVVIINGWSDHGPTTYTADVPVGAGQHRVVIEYYERNGGAVARFTEARL
ncbi:MAG TPA: PA14 domain-containing protein [Micromonosporaceae bacterium]